MKLLSPEECREISESISGSICIDDELPHQVFRPHLSNYCWLEFDLVLTSEFWTCLQRCSMDTSDQQLYVICRHPFPNENFGHSGGAAFLPSDTDSDYHSFLDIALPETMSVNIRSIGDKLIFFGDSRGWFFVANRSVEITVGANASHRSWPLVNGIRYLPFTSMLEVASGPYRRNLPEKIRREYVDNYQAGFWNISSPPRRIRS